MFEEFCEHIRGWACFFWIVLIEVTLEDLNNMFFA